MLALLRSWHPLERSTSVSDSLGLHTRRFRAITSTSTSNYNCATCTAATNAHANTFAITIPTNAISDSGTR